MNLLNFFKEDNPWLGLVIGLLGPVLGFYIYYQLVFADHVSLAGFIKFVHTPETLSKVISLSVLLNLPLFFWFIHKRLDRTARSVLAATFVYVAIIAYLKLLA